jgi:hypothetical protein
MALKRQSKENGNIKIIFFSDVTPCIVVVGIELYSKCACTLVHDGPGFDYRQEQRVSSPKRTDLLRDAPPNLIFDR